LVGYKIEILKVGLYSLTSPASAPKETQAVAVSDQIPAAVGVEVLLKSIRKMFFPEGYFKVGDTLKIWKFLR
jgi:hypothetical protein